MRKKHIYSVMVITAVMLTAVMTLFMSAMAVSKPGSSGAEVRQIQTKLKNWGYYSGSIDGIYHCGQCAVRCEI